MNFKEEIENFVIDGYKNVNTEFKKLEGYNSVLSNKENNFIKRPEVNFDYHRWSASLKSSQAFAFNIFSSVENKEFEFHMKVFDRDAQIDVKVEHSKNNIVELFEVKMFEILSLSKKKIEFKDSYYKKEEYLNSEIAEKQIVFLNTVINHFAQKNHSIYSHGIKQLCSHLFGIINEISLGNDELKNKKVKLYSFCFDNLFSKKFEEKLNNYKNTLIEFKIIVDNFLKDINYHSEIEYCGFLSAKEYIKENSSFLGEENYKYIINRYFYTS